MEKWLQQVQWASPGAINRHSDHISTVSLPQAELWMGVISGPIKNPWPLLRSCFIQRGRGKRIQVAGPYQSCIWEPGQAKLFKKDFLYFIGYSTCHRISRSKCLARPLLRASSHLYTSKGLSAHWKQSSGQKYKSNQHNWMHIVCRIRQQPWGASSVFSYNSFNNHTADKWGLSGSTCNMAGGK